MASLGDQDPAVSSTATMALESLPSSSPIRSWRYRALFASVVALHGKGKTAEEAAAAVDLTQFKDTLGITRVGTDPQAARRMYQLLSEGST